MSQSGENVKILDVLITLADRYTLLLWTNTADRNLSNALLPPIQDIVLYQLLLFSHDGHIDCSRPLES